jgi:hypothetical protein
LSGTATIEPVQTHVHTDIHIHILVRLFVHQASGTHDRKV